MVVSLNNNGFQALLPFMREEFALSRTQVGYYSTCFYLSAAMLSVFTGNFVDKLGARKSFLLGIFGLGAMMFLYGLAPSYQVILIIAVVAGLAHSIVPPSITKGVMMETPPDKRAFSMGAVQSGMGIGGFAGAGLLPLLGQILGWRTTIQIAGITVLLAAILILKVYREKSPNNDLEAKPEEVNEKKSTLKENLYIFLTNKQFLAICFLGVIIAGSSFGAILPHFAVFLSEDLHMSRAAAGFGLGIFQLGGLVGRPTWGWFSDRLLKGKRKTTLSIIGLVAGCLFLLCSFFITDSSALNPFAVYLFSFLLGFSAFGWHGIFFITIGELAGKEKTGGASGIAFLFNRAGTLVVPPFFGLIADIQGNYAFSWFIFGVLIIVASFLYYTIAVKAQ